MVGTKEHGNKLGDGENGQGEILSKKKKYVKTSKMRVNGLS